MVGKAHDKATHVPDGFVDVFLEVLWSGCICEIGDASQFKKRHLRERARASGTSALPSNRDGAGERSDGSRATRVQYVFVATGYWSEVNTETAMRRDRPAEIESGR